MFNVLIVDDDIVIRQDLKTIIKWEKYGFRISAEADNGAAALEIIKRGNIDMVITDIYMPVMDGVQLIKESKIEYPGIEFLVISNYDEFKYVKDAMKFGAFDYILKYEIDAGTFLPIIHSVKKSIYGRKSDKGSIDGMSGEWRHILEEKFWRNIFSDGTDVKSIGLDAEKLGIVANTSPYTMVFIDFNPDIGDEEEGKRTIMELEHKLPAFVTECSEVFKYHFIFKLEGALWVVILRAGEKSHSIVKNNSFIFSRELMKRIKDRFNASVVVGIGDVITKFDELPRCFHKMRECIESKFYYGLDVVLDMSYSSSLSFSYDDTRMQEFNTHILNNITNLDFESAAQNIDLVVKEFNSWKLSPGLVYEYFVVLLLSIRRILLEKGIDIIEVGGMTLEKKVRSLRTLNSIETYLKELLSRTRGMVLNVDGINCRRDIQKALGFIKANYMKNITLENIAAYTGVSKNYFCRLFKEETGESFIEYLNKLRVEKAKQLIAQSSKSMKEISSLVGLDYAYFCKIFRNTEGKRPSELRR